MSDIDITKPVAGLPTTQSVRDNFAAAATEIDAAQTTADAAQTLANDALPKIGGVMTGPIILDADPTTALEATTKQYVDANAGGGGGFLNDYFGVLGFNLTVIAGGPITAIPNGQYNATLFGFASYQDSGTDGDTVEAIAKNMVAGSYLLRVHYSEYPSSGIVETWFNGVLVDTVDEYEPASNGFLTVEVLVTVLEGDNVIRRVVNGKNGNSSAFYTNISYIELFKQ